MGSQIAMLPQNTTESRSVTYAHPGAAFFHCAFKVAAVLTYLLCGLFSASYVINFVITIALLATDFWTVKNVTGRLLVGLRWWNDVNERGESTWKFESLDQQALDRVNRNDSWTFWWSLYMNSAAWIALAIIAIIRLNFDYFVITVIAISLTSANTAGYSKCRKGADFSSSVELPCSWTFVVMSDMTIVFSTSGINLLVFEAQSYRRRP